MSEENTQNIPDGRSFEERVFARFDAMDARFDAIDARLQRLEDEAERRAVEIKAIGLRTLAVILAVRQGVDEFRRSKQILISDCRMN